MQIDLINRITGTQFIRSAWSVQIDGADYTSTFAGWSCTHDAGTSFASAQLQVAQPIGLAAGRHTVTIFAGWNGLADMVMKGEIATTQQTLWKPGQTFSVGGFAKRCNDPILVTYDAEFGTVMSGPAFAYCTTTDALALVDPLYYTAIDLTATPTDAAIIQHVLQQYGIFPSTSGYNIIASPRHIAALDPILWEPGMTGWQIISRLDNISPNYRTADGRSGAVIRREIFGSVPAITRHDFHQGTDILGLEMTSDIGTVVNEVLVKGAQDVSTGLQVQAIVPGSGVTPSVYISDPPGTRLDQSINDAWIETIPEAEAIGGDLLGRLSQPLATYTLTTFGCPDIDVGDAIGLTSDLYTGNLFVAAHTLTASQQAPFLQSVLQLRGSTSADVRTNQPPIPQMTISVILEQVYVGSTLTPLAMITVDATTSTDPDGTIASWTIVLDGQTYTGTDITTAVITRATTSASPISVTLTVVDNGGLSASLTQAATWTTDTAKQEPVALAELTDGAATTDEVTWNTFTAAVTAVAPIALGDGTLYGCSDGKMYRSTDLLATAPTLVTTLPAGINCLWNNEHYVTRWLCGLANGALYLSLDKGVTWTLLHTFAAAINDLTESPFAINDMLVASGTTLYHTYSGTAWDTLYAWTSTLNRFASAQYGGQTVIYSGYASGDVVRHTDTGGTLLAGTMPGAHPITGLTLDRTQELVYVFNNQASGNAYTMTAGGTFTAGTDIGTAVNRAIRSGSGQWTYVASDGALVKWMNTGTQAYDVRRVTSPTRVLAVGYAALGTPVVPHGNVELYLLTGPGDPSPGVWHIVPGYAPVLLNNGLPTASDGVYWTWLSANPFNPSEMILSGTRTAPTAGTHLGHADIAARDEAIVQSIRRDASGNYDTTGGTQGNWVMRYTWQWVSLIDFVGYQADKNINPFWYTNDAGATWHPLEILSPPAIQTPVGSPPTSMSYSSSLTWNPRRVEWSRNQNGYFGILGSGQYASDLLTSRSAGVQLFACFGTREQLGGLVHGQYISASIDIRVDLSWDTNLFIRVQGEMMAGPTDVGGWVFHGMDDTAHKDTSGGIGNSLPNVAGAALTAYVGIETLPGASHAMIGAQVGSGDVTSAGTLFTTQHVGVDGFVPGTHLKVGVGLAATHDAIYAGAVDTVSSDFTVGVTKFPGTSLLTTAHTVGAMNAAGAAVVAATSGVAIDFIRSDRQHQTTVAAKTTRDLTSGQTDVWTYDGTTWGLQTGPTTSVPLTAFVEVVNRT